MDEWMDRFGGQEGVQAWTISHLQLNKKRSGIVFI